MTENIDPIKYYKVYQYHYLDYLGALIPLEDFYNDVFSLNGTKEEFDHTVKKIKELLKDCGWEGDGRLSIIWLPPFVDSNTIEDTWGAYLWHVKQSNNGTSFIASKRRLPFKRIGNTHEESDTTFWESIHILQDECEGFIDDLRESQIELSKELESIRSSNVDSKKEIIRKLIGYTQCDIVAELHTFFDDCYLALLIEVLQNGNGSNLKLKKSTVKIDLESHVYEDEKYGEPDLEATNWLSMSSLVSNIYWSFQFEPSKEKLNKVFKGVDYKIKTEWRD